MTRQPRHVPPVVTSAGQRSGRYCFPDHDGAGNAGMGVSNPTMLVLGRPGTGKSAAGFPPWLPRSAR